jgi:type II secretory pathway component PulK
MRSERRARRSSHFTQRGVALIAVASVVAFIAVLAAEFSYNTNIDYGQATNARDDMRAYFLARSGMNLSRLVTKVQRDIIDKNPALSFIKPDLYVPLVMQAFGGSLDDAKGMASMLGSFDLDKVKGLGLPAGEFSVDVTTDDGKLNVNCAGSRNANTQKQVELMLTALVAPPAYDRMFEERDGDGQFTDRATFIKAIIDYVDQDTAGYGASGQGEDYGYEARQDAYKARDNYLDSVEELRMVRGMDERRWALFGPAFTIYGGCKVNVGAAQDLNVIMAIIYQSAKDPNDPVLRDINKLWRLAGVIAQAQLYGYSLDGKTGLVDFAKLVKDPVSAIAGELGMGTGDDSAAKPPPGSPLANLQIEGVELDQTKLEQIARAGGRRTYRVVTSARIGKIEKKIVAVYDADVISQNGREPGIKGAWVYWREE